MNANRRLSLVGSDDGPPEPVDPDFALICDYLSKALSMKDADAVEQRLVDDEAFFEKVWPVVRVWRLPRYVRQRRERARRKAQGHVPQRHASPAAPPLAIVPPLPAQRRRSVWPALSDRTWRRLGTAAVITIVAGSVYSGFRPHKKPIVVVENRLDRAPVAGIRHPVQVETGPGESRIITLSGGSRLILRPNSRMTYEKIPGSRVHVTSGAFDGELALELNKEDRFVAIGTSSGRALFAPGTYALRCEPGCAGMLVTVGVGFVQLRGDAGSADAVNLNAGEKGRVPKHGSPEKVTPGDGWPALEPAKVP